MAKVTTKADLFGGDVNVISVVTLIRCFTSGRHQWELDLESVGVAERYFALNVPNLSGSIGALARKAWTTKTAWVPPEAPKKTPTYEVSQTTIDAVLVDLQRPGVIVVEDIVSDKEFLYALIQAFGESRIQYALDQGWLELRHSGGGGRVVAVTEDEFLKFNIIARVGAVIDSDSLYPGHHTDAHVRAKYLTKMGLSCHVLTYREIENYIPNKALATIRPPALTNKRLSALKRLNQYQRGHLDIKKGLGRTDGRFERAPREHQELYDGVPAEILKILEKGFGMRVSSCLSQTTLGMTIRDYASIGTDVHGELSDLLSMIRSLI